MITLLIVDDSPTDRSEACELLRSANDSYRLLEASSGDEALAVLEREGVACVLFAEQLGDMSGLDLLAAVQARFDLVATIVITASDDEQAALGALEAGATNCLSRAELRTAALPRAVATALRLRRTEQELQQRAARYQQLFLTLTEGVVQIEMDGRVSEMNPAASRLLGPGVQIGAIPRWQAHDERGDVLPEAEHPIVQALNGHGRRSAVVWVAHRPGSGHWLLITAVPLERVDGSRAALATITDLSDYRRAQLALEQSERKFRAIFEAQPGAILYTDDRSRIIETNPSVENLFDFSSRELMGRNLWILFKGSDTHAKLFREFAEQGGDTLWKRRLMLLRKDSSVFPGEVTLAALRDDERSVVGYVWMIFDVTEQERVQRELVRSQRELARVREEERLRIARELHDNAVQELVALGFGLANLKRELTDRVAPEAVAQLEAFKRKTTAAVKLLRSIISNLRPAGLEEFGLEAALIGYTSKLSRTRTEGMPEVTLDLPPGIDAVPTAVALALFRTAQEALNNVIEHAGAQHVRIEIRLLDRQVTLLVEDDGRGFELPHSLGDLGREHRFGLVELDERATLLEGTFSVRSRPGIGTEVAMSLPLEPTPAEENNVQSGS